MCQAAILTCVLRVEYEEAIRQRDDARAERDEARAALSAAEAERDAYATEIKDYKLELNSLREEVERLEAERKNGVWFYSRRWSESERTQLLQELAEARAERDGFFNSVRIAANIGTQDRSILIQAVGALRNDLVDTRAELKGQRAELEGLRELHRCVVSGPVSKRDEGRCLSLIEERDSLHAEVERLKAELAWVTETELGLAKQKQNLNRAKLQAVYDALAEHCQTAKHPSPLLLEQLQSLYRLLEDPA